MKNIQLYFDVSKSFLSKVGDFFKKFVAFSQYLNFKFSMMRYILLSNYVVAVFS